MNSDRRFQLTINLSSASQVFEHLCVCDESFVPQLSDRVNLPDYAEKIVKNATRVEIWKGEVLLALLACYTNDPSNKTAFITNVSVLPEIQGKGWGKVLLTAAIQHIKELAFKQVELEVGAMSVAARNLYLKAGFITVSAQDGKEFMRLVLQHSI